MRYDKDVKVFRQWLPADHKALSSEWQSEWERWQSHYRAVISAAVAVTGVKASSPTQKSAAGRMTAGGMIGGAELSAGSSEDTAAASSEIFRCEC